MSDDNKTKDVIEAAAGLIKAVPVYDDAIQPGAREFGAALGTVGKLVNTCLMPIRGLIWGADKIGEFLQSKVAEQLNSTPPEDIETPKPTIAGPVLESLRFAGNEPELQDLYAKLLSASMDKTTAHKAHPAFIEVIRQITPDESRLLKYFRDNAILPVIDVNELEEKTQGFVKVVRNFANFSEKFECEHEDLLEAYIDNLCRLGLVEVDNGYTDNSIYVELETHPAVMAVNQAILDNPNVKPQIVRKTIQITDFGFQFIDACIKSHDELRASSAQE